MKIVLTFLTILLLAVPGFAQQDPDDQGAQDSIIIQTTSNWLDVVNGDSVFTLELYFFNDAQNVINGGGTFSWNHDGIVLDSAVRTPLATGSFVQIFTYYKSNIDSSNANKLFLFTGVQFGADGLDPAGTPQHLATYWFHVDSLFPTDSVIIDSVIAPGGNFTFSQANPTATWDVAFSGLIIAQDPSDVNVIETGQLPTKFSLSQNYPNPFNPSTNIQFDVPKAARVNLSVFNVLGQRVVTLIDEDMAAGTYEKIWYGTNEGGSQVASGIYFYRLEADNKVVDTKKMMLLK